MATMGLKAREEAREYALELMMKLYDNEVLYTEQLYTEVGLVKEVLHFVHYNANKALQNLGFDPIFPDEICQVNPKIIGSLKDDSSTTHDFFSINGSAYFMPRYEETEDSDYVLDPSDYRVSLYGGQMNSITKNPVIYHT